MYQWRIFFLTALLVTLGLASPQSVWAQNKGDVGICSVDCFSGFRRCITENECPVAANACEGGESCGSNGRCSGSGKRCNNVVSACTIGCATAELACRRQCSDHYFRDLRSQLPKLQLPTAALKALTHQLKVLPPAIDRSLKSRSTDALKDLQAYRKTIDDFTGKKQLGSKLSKHLKAGGLALEESISQNSARAYAKPK